MPKLTLIEGLSKYEGINEAKAIADVLKIMKRGLDQPISKNLGIKAIRANSKEHFIKSLERNRFPPYIIPARALSLLAYYFIGTRFLSLLTSSLGELCSRH